MIYYRLLRDNKETGPYAEEEMIAKGFKPYDLLWAEGKTAGWQYPSEIPAFKMHAPIVEEQPYDRFYKKPTPQKSIVEDRNKNAYSLQTQQTNENFQPQSVARPAYNFNLKELPSRHIHVTLPSGNTVNLTTAIAKKEVKDPKENADVNKIPAVTEVKLINTSGMSPEPKQAFTVENIVAPSPVIKEIKPIAADIEPEKNMEKPSSHTSFFQNIGADFSWTLVLGAVIGIATMVGLGIMIGLSINRDKNDAGIAGSLRNKTKQLTDLHTTKTTAPVVSAVALPVAEANEPVTHPAPPAKNKELVQHAFIKTPVSPDNNLKDEKNTSSEDKFLIEKNQPLQSVEQPVQHIKTQPVATAANIEKSVNISLNKFKSGAFGGISNLKCTLFNGSKLPLQSVEVEVDYIQANNKIYKTEKLLFKDIAAGSEVTVEAPASSRGVKIASRIVKVNAKETGLLITTTAKS